MPIRKHKDTTRETNKERARAWLDAAGYAFTTATVRSLGRVLAASNRQALARRERREAADISSIRAAEIKRNTERWAAMVQARRDRRAKGGR